MSKRPRRSLTQIELEEEARKIDMGLSDSDFDSDVSVEDPGWSPQNSSEEENDSGEEPETIEEALQELEAEENEVNEHDNTVMGNSNWYEYLGRHKNFQFTGLHGVQKNISPESSPLDIFLLFLDDEVLDIIVKETNRFAEQCLAVGPHQRFARLRKWVPTDPEEMKKFFGLMIWMGLVRLGTLPSYWATHGIYRLDLPKSVMSRNRFQLALSMLHFNNNVTTEKGNRLGKIEPLLDILQQKFKSIFYPGEDIVIDESLVPWRGRLIFRQYIPNKAHRYGIKLFKLCSTDGYTWAIKIYSGKSASGEHEVGLAKKVCLSLCEGLLHEGRTLYVDNFYTSYDLAQEMLQKQTHVVGTLRANKKDIPKDVLLAKLKRGEVVSKEDDNGIVVIKWKDTRDVRLLSTKHAPTLAPARNARPLLPANDQPSTSATIQGSVTPNAPAGENRGRRKKKRATY